MFKIGDFAKFSRVSVRMLRHYDQFGLLKPAQVDPDTDYRYYRADQLPRLNRIIALKDLGFSLDQIGDLLHKPVSAEQMRGMLELRRAEVESQLREGMDRLAQVQTRIDQVANEEDLLIFDVVLRSVQPQQVAAILGEPGEGVAARFEELEAYVARWGTRSARPPLSLDQPGAEEDQAGILVAVPVEGQLPTSPRVRLLDLPAVEQMACLVFNGGYDQMHLAGQALLTWIEANGFEVAGPSREVYLRFGAGQQGYQLSDAFLASQPNQFVTELQIPVRRIEGEDHGLLLSHSQTNQRAASGPA